jgi:hypothetical protein
MLTIIPSVLNDLETRWQIENFELLIVFLGSDAVEFLMLAHDVLLVVKMDYLVIIE